jgi:hypothetical protein
MPSWPTQSQLIPAAAYYSSSPNIFSEACFSKPSDIPDGKKKDCKRNAATIPTLNY